MNPTPFWRWPAPGPPTPAWSPAPFPRTHSPGPRLPAQEPRPLTQAVACLAAHAAQTLDQGADGGGAGGCRRPRTGQPVQQVVGELGEEVGAAGGRQVAQRPDGPLAHGQARAAQLRQEAVQEAGVEGAERGAQPGGPEGASGGPPGGTP